MNAFRRKLVVSIAALVVLLSGLGVAAQAQTTLAPSWYQQSPANNPGQRYIESMAYDAGHGQVVLFGGFNSDYANDTWLWNGSNWTNANPATVPPKRAAPAMVYDPVHGNVMMFGGFTTSSTRLNDTWLWNGTNWTNVTPATITTANSPSPRSNAGIAFDAALGEVVLFGGTNGSGLSDTWLWNGSAWTQWTNPTPASNPAPRADPGMAYDAATSQVVLFGGDVNAVDMNDTWTWNGTAWSQQSISAPPPARDAQGMDYDAALGQVVMFGGESAASGGSFLNDTWAYNGTNWTQLSIPPAMAPAARVVPNAMVYDSGLQQLVMFGGYDNGQLSDTWEFGLPGNFGNVNVCPSGTSTPPPCSKTLTFTYNVASTTTFGATQVVTQGTTGLDFTLGTGSTCSGTTAAGSCTVNVTFTPGAPGLRVGAVDLVNNSGVILATAPISGVGQGPAAAVAPGSPRNVALGLTTPYGVAVDAAGNTYITDSTAAKVLKVTPNSTTTQLGVTFTTPAGVAVDGQGNVYVADQGANVIVEVPSGCISSSCQYTLPASELESVQQDTGVAVDGAGDVFFSSLNPAQVLEIPAGCTSPNCVNVVWTPPNGVTNSKPNGIAVDAAGDLFIADGAIEQLYEVPAGCTTASCQLKVGTELGVPTGVAVDAAGDLFVSDLSFGVFEVPAGCASYGCQTAVSGGGAPYGVAVDGQGDIFVPASTNGSVIEVNRSQTEAFNFPSTNVGSTSTPESLSLQNIGNQTLSAVSPGLLVVTGPNFANVAGSGSPADCSTLSALTPGEVCNVSLTFTPQTAGNPLTSTLVFHDNSLNATSATQTTVLAGVATSTTFTIGGTISGLTGTGLVLQNNLGNNLPISGNGSFTFSTPLATGSPYSVTVLTQPSGQSCNVTNASGTVASANITNVQVSCVNLLSYALTVTEAGTGTGTVTDILGQISCVNGAGTCSGSYPGGTLVTLTATASGNSVFVGWGGACSSSGANALCIVTMNSALNVTATFVAPPPTQAGTLKPITAGVVYGQLGGFTTATKNDGGLNANALFDPDGLALDSSGNVYVSDQQNSRVLFYPAGSTTATRVYGQLGNLNGGPANNGGISANTLSGPYGIALDSGNNLYVADYGNNRVLFYPAGSTTATRVYGQGGSFTSNSANNGGISANSLYLPTAVALDSSGNLYVVDSYNSRVLFYPAGSTTATRVYGQGGSFSSRNTGTSANGLNFPIAATLDSSGDLYVSDGNNNRVLFYPNNSTTATQVYGQLGSFTSGAANNGGVSANSLQTPAGLTVDSSGNLYVADANNGRVLFYPFGSTTATRVYGQGGSFTSNTLNNGGISANSLAQVWVPALDSNGNLYVADLGNNRVLEYGSFGNVNACPANQTTPAPCNKTVTYSYAPAAATTLGSAKVVTQGVTGLDFSFGSNTCSGIISAGSSCSLNVNFTPLAPGLRAGALELFDTTGSPVATAPAYGVGQGPEIVFGPATQSIINTGTLSTPKGVLVDAAGNLFVSDTTLQQVIKIAPNGTRTTVGVGLQFPQQMAEDGAGNLYIADNNLNEIVEVPAGCTTSSCQLYLGANYRSQLGVAVDGAGDVFFGDFLDGEVVKSPAGCTSSACQTVVYNPGEGSSPVGITVDSVGNLYVADFGLKQVVEVPVGCASSACQLNIGNGFWSQPDGVAVDAAGDVFVADAGLDEIVEAPAGCTASACLGVLVSGINVVAVTLDAGGDLVFEDFVNSQVLELSRSQIPSLSFAQTNVGSTSSDSPRSINLQNIGNQPLTGSLALNLGGNFTQNASLDCSVAFPLAPGAGCIDTFSFIPQSATFLSGTAVFADNNLNGSAATQTITLSGIGATNNVAGTVAVPNVVGQTQTAASAPITSVGLTMGTVTTESSSSVASGSIISQSPAAGTQVAVGSTVNLLVSTGIALPPSPNPLSLENNYFLTGDYVSAGVTLRGTGAGGLATGTINIPAYTPGSTQGVPAGADIIDAFLYWETVENTPVASSFTGTFNGYSILGQQIGNDIPNYVDGAFTGTLRAYRADVNIYLPIGANGVRFAAGNYTVSLPDSGGTGLPLTEGASLVLIYRVLSLSPNFPLKSIVIYDGAAVPTSGAVQVVQGFYDAVGGANGTGKSTNLFASGGAWNNSVTSVTLGQSNQYTAPLNPADAYAAVILSTPVNNSDNDGILDAWKTGPTAAGDFHAGQPGYYDVKSNTWVGLPGAQHGEKDLFVQLDYMCGAVLSSGACDPTQENLFPSPDANGNDPLAMVQQAFANSGVQLHLQIGNAIPETTCVDSSTSQLCQFPNQPGVIGWKNSLEFSKLYPRNLAACLSGGDCTTRFPYGQKDSYHYVLFGHSLAIPAFNTRYATLTSINVLNGITTLVTVDGVQGSTLARAASRSRAFWEIPALMVCTTRQAARIRRRLRWQLRACRTGVIPTTHCLNRSSASRSGRRQASPATPTWAEPILPSLWVNG